MLNRLVAEKPMRLTAIAALLFGCAALSAAQRKVQGVKRSQLDLRRQNRTDRLGPARSRVPGLLEGPRAVAARHSQHPSRQEPAAARVPLHRRTHDAREHRPRHHRPCRSRQHHGGQRHALSPGRARLPPPQRAPHQGQARRHGEWISFTAATTARWRLWPCA